MYISVIMYHTRRVIGWEMVGNKRTKEENAKVFG